MTSPKATGKMGDLKEAIDNLFNLSGQNLKELNELHKQDSDIQEQIEEFKNLSKRINKAIGILDDYFYYNSGWDFMDLYVSNGDWLVQIIQ